MRLMGRPEGTKGQTKQSPGSAALSRHSAKFRIAFAFAAALAVCGCKNSAGVLQDQNDGGWFSKPVDMFAKPDWARATTGSVNLGPKGPVGAEDMVNADGSCAVAPVTNAQPSDASAAADQPATPAAAAPNSGLQRLEPTSAPPPVAGGIALGMTECQAVQRAGSPNDVAISADQKGERKVVLTYLGGPWPGIYTFVGGRLNVVERAPEQPKPAASKKNPKKKTQPKTANHESERGNVQ
jgi:hypothetical protein